MTDNWDYKNQNALGGYSKIRGWNDLTLMCYERNCICKGCEFHNRFEGSTCQVKASVLESVRVLGIPYERDEVVISE